MSNLVKFNPKLNELREEMQKGPLNIAQELVSINEKLVNDAITYALGRDTWEIDDVLERCKMMVKPDKTQTFTFDDKEMVHFGKVLIRHSEGDGSHLVTAMQEYKVLYKEVS